MTNPDVENAKITLNNLLNEINCPQHENALNLLLFLFELMCDKKVKF